MRLLILLFLLLPVLSSGQNDADIDQLALNAPNVSTRSVEQLAAYFVKNIPDDRGRIRAIYAWITMNVRYLDTNNSSEIWATPEHLDRQRPEQVLKNRTAVCQGFANLFQSLAKAAGLECQVVTGIVKNEDGEVMRVGHAWVAALVQGKWQLFDPTWSAHRPGDPWQVNTRYFMTAPEKFVLSHLPDDPAWQLLENPLTENEFRENEPGEIFRLVAEQSDPVFNFHDTLNVWVALDSVSRSFSAESRILQFNGSNQRVLFGLGQGYWGLFFDLRARLDSLADRAIIHENILVDTLEFEAQLALMDQYHSRARYLFSQITESTRAAQTERFYTPEDVAAMIYKLRGSMWTAVFEYQLKQNAQNINETSLSALGALANKASQAYTRAIRNINCNKLQSTCFEIWHNLSLAHLQLADRYSAYAQNLLSDKNASKYLKTAESTLKTARQLYQQAEAETRQLLSIPPPYAFVRDRLRSIRQGLFNLQESDIRVRRVAISAQVEAALSQTNRTPDIAKALTGKLQPIIDDLGELTLTIEDAVAELGADYCDVTLFNLHLEGYAMRFNLSSLFFRSALDLYKAAAEKNSVDVEKKRINTLTEKALASLKEARHSVDFLAKSKKVSSTSVEQRTLQINTLSKSIREFMAEL
jgi:hypothetical protein